MDNSPLSKNLPVIVAVSGGADSLCLLGTLHEQGYSLIVAHFDHQLRPDSAEDARFVAQIAAQYNLPFVTASEDVAAYAKAEKQTIEEAARNLRYHFLFAQARQHNAQAVAVGHTADDQVETVLMHFLRGAGLRGLKGIQPRTILPNFDPKIPLVRPILDLWRVDTEAYCAAHNLVPRDDPSNASDDYFRNRLRHVLIPELEGYNPRFRETLQRTSQALQGDHALLNELIAQTWQQMVIAESPHYISFPLSSFSNLSPALIRNLIKVGMEKLRPVQSDISFATLARAVEFISNSDGAQRSDLASGLFLLKEGDALHLTSDEQYLPLDAFPQLRVTASLVSLVDAETATSQKDAPRSEMPITLPCEIDLGNGWVLSGTMPKTTQMLETADPFQVTFDADVLGENLSLRTRRAGDRFRPLGMAGKSMKLKDFFINVKLPRRARDHYPLLGVNAEVVWVPGYRPAHRTRVTEMTQRVVTFRLHRISH